jgi:hypothetical protein
MSEYTPGPWRVLENSDSSIWAVRVDQPLVEAFPLEGNGQGNVAANARLIQEAQFFGGVCLQVIGRFGEGGTRSP